MNEDRYPSEDDLQRIREWPYVDMPGLMKFVRSIWWMPDWGWAEEGEKYYVSTGGWSGNESIMGALQDNDMFWRMCWQESRRGGHYKFEIPSMAPAYNA